MNLLTIKKKANHSSPFFTSIKTYISSLFDTNLMVTTNYNAQTNRLTLMTTA